MANDHEPGSPEMVDGDLEDGAEPLWTRVVGYIFVALLLGSGFLLGAGGSPYWIEIIAAAFLWFVVVLFLFCLSAGLLISLFPHPVPETQQAPPNTVQNRSPWRKLRRYSFRLLYLFFVGALFVSGRPILAGLYI